MSCKHLVFLLAFHCLVATPNADAAQQQVAAVVARGNTALRIGERVTGQTEPGEIYSLITRQDELIWVQNDQDKKGWLGRDQVVALNEAQAIFDALIRREPDRAVHYERRGVMWSSRGDQEKAAADWDHAIELGSRNPNVYLNRGIHRSTQGEFEGAVADYSRAVELGLKDVYVYVNRGVARYALGKFEEAVADFDRAIEGGAKGFSIYVNRASAKLAAGQEVAAIDDLNEAIRLDPKNPAGHYERGRAWQQMDKLDQAIEDFDQALKLDPDFAQAYGGRGFARFLKGESEKAIADFDQLIQRNPQAVVAYNNRGYNKQLLGRYAEAIADFRRAIELAPQYQLAYQNLAWLLATCPEDQVRDGQAALKAVAKAYELSEGKSPEVLKAMAAAYAETGDFEKATAWQAKVLEQTPEDDKSDEQQLLDLYKSQKPYRIERP